MLRVVWMNEDAANVAEVSSDLYNCSAAEHTARRVFCLRLESVGKGRPEERARLVVENLRRIEA